MSNQANNPEGQEENPFEVLRDQIVAVQIRNNAPIYANIDRVTAILASLNTLLEEPGLRQQREDLVRFLVVFVHASIEEILRNLAERYSLRINASSLNKFPLIGLAEPSKFYLGELAKHRGRTVNELITESVKQNLLHRTFNNSDDIVWLLEAIGFEIDPGLKSVLPIISEIMSRRHQIVHRADVPAGGSEPAAIDTSTMRKWMTGVGMFVALVNVMEVNAILPEASRVKIPVDELPSL